MSMNVKFIDIEYSNSNMKNLLSVSVNYDFTMACLNYHGGLLAKKGIKPMEDEYESEDEENSESKFSIL